MSPYSNLVEVERCIENRAWRGKFPPELEHAFLEHYMKLRVRALNRQIIPVLATYNLFLLADVFLLPKTWLLAVILHLAVVSPIIILLWYIYPRLKNPVLSALADGAPTVLMVAQIMTNYALNDGIIDSHYQYFAVLVLLYANVNLRPRYAVAVPLSVIVVSLYAVLLFLGSIPIEAKIAGCCTMAGAAFISLVANLRFDLDARHAFLRSLQDKLRVENAKAEAMRDALTGMKNRRYLEDFESRVMPEMIVLGMRLGVIMIDIDYFKHYNDEYGHQAGDDCLRAVAHAVASCVREASDIAIRYGGEEFMVLLPGSDREKAIKVAERIRRAVLVMQIPHLKSGVADHVTVSLGVSSGKFSADCFKELIAWADTALYAAKEDGRNRVCFGALGNLQTDPS